jgi:excisionase family DNA binding protein
MDLEAKKLQKRKDALLAMQSYLDNHGGLLTIKEVAQQLSISNDSVKMMIADKKLFALKEFDGQVPAFLISNKAVLPYVEELMPILLDKASDISVCSFMLDRFLPDGDEWTSIAEILAKGPTDDQLAIIRREVELFFTHVAK